MTMERKLDLGKSLFIAEKPSVAMEFAKALKQNMQRHDGYQEGSDVVVTWCVGHLVGLSYPDKYDPALKRWSMGTLPFIPDHFLYEVLPGTKKQFGIVKNLLNRKDIDTIYVCTDSGREGEYIYRLVAQEAGNFSAQQKRVWIDSQTEEEILRGIREAKDLSAYDHLADAAYLRAKEDYLMGINFSRLLTLRYGDTVAGYLGEQRCVIAVGRVMTCVQGMIVRREREIRSFVKTPFYRVIADTDVGAADGRTIACEFRGVEGSAYYQSPKLYKENGFKKKEDAESLIASLGSARPLDAVVDSIERKKEKKNPPLLYNLAELQNDCSRMFHISPDQTLSVVQGLYEKKMVTYPRTDARVLSTAVAKEIGRNIGGLKNFAPAREFVDHILENGSYKGIAKTRYTNDKQITDHYALIPTGQGMGALRSLSSLEHSVYSLIVKRFLSIFYPPAQYTKASLIVSAEASVPEGSGGTASNQPVREKFFGSIRMLTDQGYLAVMPYKKKAEAAEKDGAVKDTDSRPDTSRKDDHGESDTDDPALLEAMSHLRKGSRVKISDLSIKEGETSPPKRYTSGSMILAMENAGQLIEDEELRAQIKGSGIGTSATRAEILKKLVADRYISLNTKTQVLSPTQMGEMIYDVVYASIRSLLNPELTASWEKGLTYVADAKISSEEYMQKLSGFIHTRTDYVKQTDYRQALRLRFDETAPFYAGAARKSASTKSSGSSIKKNRSAAAKKTT